MPPAAVATSLRPGLGARFARMATPGQVVASFAAVMVAYWLYALLVVPLIEPSVEQQARARASDEEIHKARNSASARQQTLSKYFPAGSWELDNPAIWESEQAMFIFKSPEPQPDGRLKLRWCTLLVFPKNPKNAGGRSADVQPIVMRASEGAVLQFDQPVSLKNLDLSQRKLTGGQLKGEIMIRREPSRPGADDALTVTTRDMELVQDRAWTPQKVTFQMGRSHGSGRELVINLAKDTGAKGFRNAGGNGGAGGVGSLRTLELVHDVVMHLDLGQGAPPAAPTATRRPDAADSQVKITCQGPFQYDFAQYAASFRDRVDVVRQIAGPSDVINCELLIVYFVHGEPGEPAPPPTSPPVASDNQISGVKVRVIEARGDPVTLRSPSRKIDIHCRGFNYFPGPPGTTGRIVALGPGWLQGDLPKDASGKYLIEWTREFRYEPQGPHEVASLHGGASVRFGQMGVMMAKNRFDAMGKLVEEGQLLAWLSVTKPNPTASAPNGPSGPADQKWEVQRVTAQGDVTVDAPQLAGSMGKLEARIDRPPPVPGAAPPSGDGAPKAAAAPRPNSAQRFSLEAGNVQIRLVPDAQQFALADATLEGQARLRQISQPRPGEKPLVVAGDRLDVTGAHTSETQVRVVGRPGYLEAGGMVLRGETINMQKQTSRLWIQGPGRMSMPMEQDFDGKPLARPQMVDIDWRGGMNFQSQKVTFERVVEVKSQWQLLATEKLEATLSRPIDFSAAAATPRARPGEGPQLATVRSIGAAFLQSRQFDDHGKQTSFDQVEGYDLLIDRATGAVNAKGPGTLTHVGYGSQPSRAVPLVQAAAERPAAPRAAGSELTYLNVQFQRSLSGNLNANQRAVTFGEPTKTVYGPVGGWDEKLSPDDPQRLGPNSMVLDARTLTVREMPSAGKSRGQYELVAEGNVQAEGPQFFARGQKATYSQEKDQLILKGSPAELSSDNPRGGGRNNARANEITYSIKLQHVRLSGAQSVGVDVLQNKPPDPNKKPFPF